MIFYITGCYSINYNEVKKKQFIQSLEPRCLSCVSKSALAYIYQSLPIKACDAKLMSSSTLSRTSRKQEGKTWLLEEQGRIAQTHRYSQGPKEADSWCPMSAFPSDRTARVLWHRAVFTVNKQMLHLWILQFPPYTKEENNVLKYISNYQIILK